MNSGIWKKFKGHDGRKKPDKMVSGEGDAAGKTDSVKPEQGEELEAKSLKKEVGKQGEEKAGEIGGGVLEDKDVCPNCGAELDDDSKFCNTCGARIQDDENTCPVCGAEMDGDSNFCNNCGEQILGIKEEEYEAGEPGGLEPWAVKFADGFKKIPKWVKIGVPITVILIIGVLVALFVTAGFHSPSAAVDTYFSHIQVGDYRDAYNMITHSEGTFSSYEYFKDWQSFQVDELGRLEDFKVVEKQFGGGLFGTALSGEPAEGTAFVATLRYKESSYDVGITVELAGGLWPVKRYRLKLSEGSTRLLISPLGAKISIDGMKVGEAEIDEVLQDALELGDFPNDLESAIDYVKKVINVVQSSVERFKTVLADFENVVGDVQNVIDRFSTSDFSWVEITDSVERTVQQGKDLGLELARMAIKIYWVFGGGDDGSLRAKMTRAETGIDLNNLPEGLHGVKVTLPGCKTVEETFYAPDGVSIVLEPTRSTIRSLNTAIEEYYIAYRNVLLSLKPETLKTITDGDLLEEDTQKVLDLIGKGMTEAVVLKSRKFEEYKMLSQTIAIVKVKEKWAITTFQGSSVVSSLTNVKHDVIYTLEQGKQGKWMVIEKKVD